MEKVFETPFSSAGVAPAPGLCRLGVQFCSKATVRRWWTRC